MPSYFQIQNILSAIVKECSALATSNHSAAETRDRQRNSSVVLLWPSAYFFRS